MQAVWPPCPGQKLPMASVGKKFLQSTLLFLSKKKHSYPEQILVQLGGNKNPCRFRSSLIAFVACNAGLVFKRAHFINYSDRAISLNCQTAIKQASQSCSFWYLSPIHIKPGHSVFCRCVVIHSFSSSMDNCLVFIMTEWSVQG